MEVRGETMGMGRDFPIMEKHYEDPRLHWSLDWIVWGAVGFTALLLGIIVLLWLIY